MTNTNTREMQDVLWRNYEYWRDQVCNFADEPDDIPDGLDLPDLVIALNKCLDLFETDRDLFTYEYFGLAHLLEMLGHNGKVELTTTYDGGILHFTSAEGDLYYHMNPKPRFSLHRNMEE
ncbi:hypothetical protein [Caenispirillum bisanense]|uniref:hypothetical protein n=1 Tax=Caenispirillum bisanense TaxID=414052 RepID=UPI001144026D|nr:hypothetical protein [Caenispirillum bisanense]